MRTAHGVTATFFALGGGVPSGGLEAGQAARRPGVRRRKRSEALRVSGRVAAVVIWGAWAAAATAPDVPERPCAGPASLRAAGWWPGRRSVLRQMSKHRSARAVHARIALSCVARAVTVICGMCAVPVSGKSGPCRFPVDVRKRRIISFCELCVQSRSPMSTTLHMCVLWLCILQRT